MANFIKTRKISTAQNFSARRIYFEGTIFSK